MPLAVLDIDIDAVPDRLVLRPGEDGAVILLRINGVPCGQAVLWATDLQTASSLRELIMRSANSSFWECWLDRELGQPQPVPNAGELPTATVAVCTRERPDDLFNCLAGLVAMPGEPDILVIDNAPASDATQQVVAAFPGVRYVVEPRPGLDFARNAAMHHSRGEIVAFTDDDAVPDRLWLQTLLRNFEDPLVMAACGLTMALELETDAQIAFQREGGFGRGFKRFAHDAVTTDPFESWKAGAGVSIAVRRSVMDLVGEFDPALGAGMPSMAGDETDLFRRLLAAGYRIQYDPTALNWHRHRRSMDELKRQIHGYERGAFALYAKILFQERNPRVILHVLRWLRHHVSFVLDTMLEGRPAHLPFSIAYAQTCGAWLGPWAYWRSCARVRKLR